WSHSPFEHDPGGVYGLMNIPAVFILLVLTLLLIRGTKESALVNGIIVILKVSIVLLFIGIGWHFINPANHTPMIPPTTTYTTPQGITHAYGGILGILGAAALSSSPISVSMLFRPRRKKPEIRSATCRLEFLGRSCSAQFFMCCSPMC